MRRSFGVAAVMAFPAVRNGLSIDIADPQLTRGYNSFDVIICMFEKHYGY